MKTIEKPYLRKGTLLGEDRYRIDALEEDNDIITTYLAYDVFRQKKVRIRELFPTRIMSRGAGEDQSISCKLLSSEALFKSMKSHMIARAKKLIGLYPLENITNVLAFFEGNGTVYVVEELTPGAVSLDDYLKKRHSYKFTVEALLKILSPAFSILEKLHGKGIWHGSLTPDNILVTPQGSCLLTHLTDPVEDIASEELGRPRIRRSEYCPVEMYVEDAARGPAADIFALGAIIYRYTTGEKLPPYYERINEEVEPKAPKDCETRIMDFQSDAIMKAVALYDFDRYTAASELLKDLAPEDMELDSLHSTQEEARNFSRLPYWYRKRQNEFKRYVIILAAIILAFIVIFIPRFSDIARNGRINRFYKRFYKATEYERCNMLSKLSEQDRGFYGNDYMTLPDDMEEEERSKLMTSKYFDLRLGHYETGNPSQTAVGNYEYLKIDFMLGQAWVTYISKDKEEHWEFPLKSAMDGSFTVRKTVTDGGGAAKTTVEKLTP